MILRVYHTGIKTGQLNVGESHILDRLLLAHRETSTSRTSDDDSI